MNVVPLTRAQIAAAERTLSLGTWAITFGAVLFSVLTVTPLVRSVTPKGWDWTAPILPLVVDAAVVIVVRLDATVARLDGEAGAWPVVLRWLTGLFTLALNIGDSALTGDLVGVGVHAVAPTLLIVTAEAGLAYRRAITRALTKLEAEQADKRRREQEDRAARAREQREQREQDRATEDQRQRDAREHEARLNHEAAAAAAQLRKDERDHEAALARQAEEREERRVEKEREQQRRQEETRRLQEAARRPAPVAERQPAVVRTPVSTPAPAVVRTPAVNTPAPAAAVSTPAPEPVSTPAPKSVSTPAPDEHDDKLSAADARAVVLKAVADGRSTREVARETGWSVGWVTARFQEAREQLATAGR